MELAHINYYNSIGFRYSAKYGFGIVYRTSDSGSLCFYEDGEVRENGENELHRYNNISNVLESYSRELYWYSQKNKNREFEPTGADVKFLPEKDTGDIAAAEVTEQKKTYTVKLRTVYMADTGCSCGKPDCAHRLEAYTVLKERIAALEERYLMTDKPVIKDYFTGSLLFERMDHFDDEAYAGAGIRKEKEMYGKIRTILSELHRPQSTSYIAGVIHSFLCTTVGYYYNADLLYDYRFLFAAMAGDPVIREVLDSTGILEGDGREDRQQKSNRLVLKRAVKEYDRAKAELTGKKKNSREPSEMKEFLLKYEENLPGLLTYYAESKAEITEADSSWLAEIAGSHAADPAFVSGVIEKIDAGFNGYTEWQPKIFARLLALLPGEAAISVCSRLRNLKLNLEVIKNLGKENGRKLLNCMKIDLPSFRFALEELLSDASDEEKGRFILSKLPEIPFKEAAAYWKYLKEEIPKLGNYRLLLLYTAAELRKTDSLPITIPEASVRDIEKYFDVDFQVNETEKGYSVEYRIFNAETDTVILLLKESGGKFSWEHNPIQKWNRYDQKAVKALCIKGREHEYDYAVEKASEAWSLVAFNREHEEFTREYKELCSSLSTEKILFSVDRKAEVEYHFSIGRYNMLMFRVGNTKFYLVKDGNAFLRSFREESTAAYGKDLILTHKIENLGERDQDVIRYLMTARYSISSSSDPKIKRYIYLPDSVMPALFDLLKGRTVYLEEEPVAVRLTERGFHVTVNDKYQLGTTLTEDDERFYNFGGHGFVLRMENGQKYLDAVPLSVEETDLLAFAVRQQGTCIRPILGDFKRKLYARFFGFIDVPPELERSFRLGDIRINAYFDFEKGLITVNPRYQKNEKELKETEIADLSDMARVRSFREYLAAIGFSGDVLSGEAEILSFFKMDFSALKKLCNVYLSEELSNKQILSVKKQVIRIQYEKSGVMQAFLEKSEYSEEELAAILKAIRKKKKFMILDGNRIVDLDTEEAKEFADAVEDLGLDEKELYRKKEIGMVNAIKAFAHERNCRPDSYLRSMIEEIRHYKDADLPLPALRVEWKGYQEEGYRWLRILSDYHIGGILADDMGLGKTLQMIALIKSDPTARPSLVVCPKSLVFNWESEFGKFDGETKVVRLSGTAAQRAERIAGICYEEKAVYVTSYDSLRNDVSLYQGEFQYAILDEAQYIKNVKALKTLSVKEIRAQHRFAVTGTPIENSIIDLWSIFDFIMPGYFEELTGFKSAYVKDSSYADSIAKKVGPFILKRSKADVLTDLPPKFERIISAEMCPAQRKLYDAMRTEAADRMAQSGQVFDLLPYITRLRQVCVDPSMFVDNYKGGSGKMDYLREMIPEYIARGHRLLIFSQFVKGLNSVEEILRASGIPYYLLTGATPAKERAAMTDDFNNGGEADVFLISLKAGGTGLNLTGADTVVHLDPWWNVSAENQATDRTHRIGQQRNVEVIRLIADNTIEQRVIELQQLKKEVADRMIAGDDSAITGATLEDIAFILRQ